MVVAEKKDLSQPSSVSVGIHHPSRNENQRNLPLVEFHQVEDPCWQQQLGPLGAMGASLSPILPLQLYPPQKVKFHQVDPD